ncbi:hypothetical protein [Lysobacter antibioticus]|uniref:hypothetical protein n=1 Tax=Lysobacter antibioticus TaxID=84531 RepID=UPI0003495C76|nr:hypothetical protein [Lysobacter antibioticus]
MQLPLADGMQHPVASRRGDLNACMRSLSTINECAFRIVLRNAFDAVFRAARTARCIDRLRGAPIAARVCRKFRNHGLRPGVLCIASRLGRTANALLHRSLRVRQRMHEAAPTIARTDGSEIVSMVLRRPARGPAAILAAAAHAGCGSRSQAAFDSPGSANSWRPPQRTRALHCGTYI